MSTKPEITQSRSKLNYCDRNILSHMYNNEDFCDIIFIVKNEKFPASRFVMGAASDVFQTMLQGPFREAATKEIAINDIEQTESFSCLLKYIYGFGIQVDSLSSEALLEVLKLSDLYGLPSLFQNLQVYVSNISIDATSKFSFGTISFMKLINIAYTYKLFDLYAKMKREIKSSTANVNKFLEHSEYIYVLCPILQDIFASENFYTKEVNILGAVLKWIDANTSSCDLVTVLNDDKSELSTGDKAVRIDKKSKDSGTELCAYYNHWLWSTDNVSSHDHDLSLEIESEQVSDVSDQSSEITSHENGNAPHVSFAKFIYKKMGLKVPSNIAQLLGTIRYSNFLVSDYKIFWKQNALLSEKYEEFVDSIIECGSMKPQGARKPCTDVRIVFEFDSYLNSNTYQKSSTLFASENLKFGLDVAQKQKREGQSYVYELCVMLVVLDTNCNCTEEQLKPVTFNYSLQLNSFHPFKTGKILEKKKQCTFNPVLTQHTIRQSCSHGYGNGSCPYCRNNSVLYCQHGSQSNHGCQYGCSSFLFIKNKAVIVCTTNIPIEMLNNKNNFFLENQAFVLEALIEHKKSPITVVNTTQFSLSLGTS